nr:hypothetical protein [Tanacetum cinerariifolium]
MVIGGQRWRSTTVADGEPPLTAAGPPLTTTRPPINGGWWAGQRSGLGRMEMPQSTYFKDLLEKPAAMENFPRHDQQLTTPPRGKPKKKSTRELNQALHNNPPTQPSIIYQPSKTSNPPFLSRLKKQKKDDQDERLLLIFKQIHINLPFLEAMIHMPKGAKVLKDLLSHKEKLKKASSSVKLSEECSAVIQRTPLSPDYVPGPEHLPSLDYVLDPEHPPSPAEVPYVPEPKYPEYLAPTDDEAPLEEQPLPADASPIAASPDYVADSDPEEDPKDDQADYSTDGGDSDDEPSDDDDTDDEDPEKEPFEEDDEEEEEEHQAPANSSAVPIIDPVLPAGETEALEADEPTHAPGSPIIILFSQIRLRGPKDDQADYSADGGDGDDEPSDDDDTNDEDPKEDPFEEDDEEEEEHPAPADSPTVPIVDLVLLAGETKALEADEPTHAPGSLISIPLSQTHLRRARKTVGPELPMAVEIRMRALLPSTSREIDILEADMPPQKRACLTTPAPGFEIRESSVAGAVRQPGPIESDLRRCRVEHAGDGITDTWDEIVDKLMEIAPTTLGGQRESDRVGYHR